LLIIPLAGRTKNATLYAEKNGSGSRSHFSFYKPNIDKVPNYAIIYNNIYKVTVSRVGTVLLIPEQVKIMGAEREKKDG